MVESIDLNRKDRFRQGLYNRILSIKGDLRIIQSTALILQM